jgi:hypothetical protein
MLGICVVYLFPDEDSLTFLDLSLEHLRTLTDGPFRIFACGLRLTPEHEARLRDTGIDLIDVVPFEGKPQAEHASCLDQLIDAAFSSGCEQVATFDLDSWPVVAGWNRPLVKLLSPEWPVAAVVRTELGDNFPHGSFALIDRSFWQIGRSSFSVRQRMHVDRELAHLSARPRESGSGLLAQLHREGRNFYRLHKTNTWAPHPVMGAIYGDGIFHFGAGSRQPRFPSDKTHYGLAGAIARSYRAHMNGAARHFLLQELRKCPADLYRELSQALAEPSDPAELVQQQGVEGAIVLTWSGNTTSRLR